MQKKFIKKQLIFYLFSIVFLFFLFGIIICYFHYQNYREKLQIISNLLDSEVSQIPITKTVSDLLKGRKLDNISQHSDFLEKYGYLKKNATFYEQQMIQQCKATIIFIIFLLLCLCVVLFIWNYLQNQKQCKEWSELETLLEHFLKQPSSKQKKKKEYSGYSNGIFNSSENLVLIQNHVLEQLKSYQDYLELSLEKNNFEKEMIKSLITDISHQLKNPVAGLRTCFEILENSILTEEEEKEFLNRSCEQLTHLEELMTALIQMSRLETGLIKIKREPCCLFDTLLSAVNRTYTKASEKEIEIVLETEEELKQFIIYHDKKWICEAFINILENAIKYSPARTEIQIRIIKRITFLRIEFQDQGIGIPKEEQHKIWKRFYRGNAQQIKKQSGSGIGLYLTSEIVKQHHGIVMVKPVKEYKAYEKVSQKGSIFVIQLPYREL